MFSPVLLPILALAAAAYLWHQWHTRASRRRAADIVQIIESTVGVPSGSLAIRWLSSAEFMVKLRALPESLYRNGAVTVRLSPKQLWRRWSAWKWHHGEETVTFEADLVRPPKSRLELQTVRYVARTGTADFRMEDGWEFHRATPVVLTNRSDLHKEMAGFISLSLQKHMGCFEDFRLAPRSPHFTVTIALSKLLADPEERAEILNIVGELALEASSLYELNY